MFRVLFFELVQKHTDRGLQKVCEGQMHIVADPPLSIVGGDSKIVLICADEDYADMVASMANYACKLSSKEKSFVYVASISTNIEDWEVTLQSKERGGNMFSCTFLIPATKSGSTVLMQSFLLAQPPMEVEDV